MVLVKTSKEGFQYEIQKESKEIAHILSSPNILHVGRSEMQTQLETDFSSNDKYGKITVNMLEEK